MARPPNKQPTDAELEILIILWRLGPSGLGPIHATLQESRPVALTTVATTLKTMLSKGLVSREDGERGYAWSAVVSRKAAASGLLGKVLHGVFEGSARRLVAHLIQEGKLDDRERAEILELLKDAPKDGPPRGRGGRS